jgi:plasmid maintenance system antidote protein VapI
VWEKRNPGLTDAGRAVRIATMPAHKTHKTMTQLLRESLAEADSIRGVAKATGLTHVSLVRFANGEQSLRLDLADKLAAHFGIECRRVRRREG